MTQNKFLWLTLSVKDRLADYMISTLTILLLYVLMKMIKILDLLKRQKTQLMYFAKVEQTEEMYLLPKILTPLIWILRYPAYTLGPLMVVGQIEENLQKVSDESILTLRL